MEIRKMKKLTNVLGLFLAIATLLLISGNLIVGYNIDEGIIAPQVSEVVVEGVEGPEEEVQTSPVASSGGNSRVITGDSSDDEDTVSFGSIDGKTLVLSITEYGKLVKTAKAISTCSIDSTCAELGKELDNNHEFLKVGPYGSMENILRRCNGMNSNSCVGTILNNISGRAAQTACNINGIPNPVRAEEFKCFKDISKALKDDLKSNI